MSANKNTAVMTISESALRQITGGQMGLDWDGRGHGVVPRRLVSNVGEQTSPRDGTIIKEQDPNGSL